MLPYTEPFTPQILSQLLALAARAGLPFTPLLAPGNVAHYLDVIIAAEGMLCAQL